jgi:hypothetical protein
MGIFQKYFLNQPDFSESKRPVVTLVYDQFPSDDWMNQLSRIGEYEPTRTEPVLSLEDNSAASIRLCGSIGYDEHVIDMLGLPSPLPQTVIDRCVLASNWSADFKEIMQSHLCYIVLAYDGHHENLIEQYLSLYKVASLLVTDHCLGLVNEPAWTCHPASTIKRILEPELLQMVRKSPPMIYWSGFVHGELYDTNWVFSRGYHIFNIPDLAAAIDDMSDAMDWFETFQEIFYYIYFSKAEVQAGDAIRIDDYNFYRFFALDESVAVLEGVGPTLIVERTSEEELETLPEEEEVD